MLFEIEPTIVCYFMAFFTPIVFYFYRLYSQAMVYRARRETIDQCAQIFRENRDDLYRLVDGGQRRGCDNQWASVITDSLMRLLPSFLSISASSAAQPSVSCCETSCPASPAPAILGQLAKLLETGDYAGSIDYLQGLLRLCRETDGCGEYAGHLNKCQELLNSCRDLYTPSQTGLDRHNSCDFRNDECSDTMNSDSCSGSFSDDSNEERAYAFSLDHICALLNKDCRTNIRMLKGELTDKLSDEKGRQILNDICNIIEDSCRHQISTIELLLNSDNIAGNSQFPSVDTCQNMLEVAKYFEDPDFPCDYEFADLSKEEARNLLNQLSRELCSERTIDTSSFTAPNGKLSNLLKLLCFISLNYEDFESLYYPTCKPNTPTNYVCEPIENKDSESDESGDMEICG